MNNYLIHYRTPGSKNGVRLYQYKDGRLTPAGIRRYLKGGFKDGVSKEYEEEVEFNSQQNIYPSSESKSKPHRVRPNSKTDKIDKKIINKPIKNPKDFVGPNGYKRVDGERPFKIRSPYFRDDNIKKRKNIFYKIGKRAKALIDDYFDKSLGKFYEHQLIPPKGSDSINHLSRYTTAEANKALQSYIDAVTTGNMGKYISTFVNTTRMNIVDGCARFLDSINLDDEVESFLKKLGIKAQLKDYIFK